MGGALEVAFEGVEAAGQLGPVGLEPLVELPKGLGTEAVEPTLAVAAGFDEAGVAQHLEVPGHAGLVHADGVDELGHRSLAVPYGVEDPAASRFGDRIEDGELVGHAVNIRRAIYMVKRIDRAAGSSHRAARDPTYDVGPLSRCSRTAGDAPAYPSWAASSRVASGSSVVMSSSSSPGSRRS